MGNTASAFDQNSLATMLYSIGKGANIADNGDERLAMASVANDLPAMPPSHDLEGEDNERDHDLEAKHKIFLSHSGGQKSFVADLCTALKSRDRHAFFDKSRSCVAVGEKFSPRIFDAIRQCQVGVVILSEEFFTRSKWPMWELAAMVEETKKSNRSKWPMLEMATMVEETKESNRIKKIIPVFYSISRERCCDPEVQLEWTKHWRKWEEEDKDRVDVKKWKGALEIFGSTNGLGMKDGMLDGELRAEIVEAVCKEVLGETRWDDSSVEGKTRLFTKICDEVYKGLQPRDLKSGVHVVGLYGMSGVGKTTSCKLLCEELSKEYCDKVCHVEFGSTSEVELLQKVLREFSYLDVKRLERLDVGLCRGYLKSRLSKDRVFLALDNVSDEAQEAAKTFLKANFGDGSVVLVTARSMDQLGRLGVPRENCFIMPELEHEEAKSLFLNHAALSKENVVSDAFVEKCLERCHFSTGQSLFLDSVVDDERALKHYHPLALKVLGGEISNLIRNRGFESAVQSRRIDFSLSRRKVDPLFWTLRSSFDSLLEEDQLLFLDVALRMFESAHWNALEWLGVVHGIDGDKLERMLKCLKRRSLLESFGKDYYGIWRFHVHDLWREFAEAEMKAGKFRDRRLVCDGEEWRGRVDLREYPKLEVVRLDTNGKDRAVDVRGLKHLKSFEVSSRDAVALEVRGLGTLERLAHLNCLNVAFSRCLAELGLLTNLQVIKLAGFRGDRLPDMSKLTRLRILDVRCSLCLQCINLRSLPNLTQLYLGGCWSLRSVDISGCRPLTRLSGLDEGLYELEELNVSSCSLIPSLRGLSWSDKLRKLDITGCSSIDELDDLKVLDELEELRARECDRLAMLPECRLPRLRVLDIEPRKIPTGFGTLGKLVEDLGVSRRGSIKNKRRRGFI